MRTTGLFCLLMLGSACVDKNGSYSGTINGQQFDLADAAYFSKYYDASTQPDNVGRTITVITLSTSYTMCDDIQLQRVAPSEQFMVFVVQSSSVGSPMPLKGTFDLSGASAYFTDDASCQPQPSMQIVSGTLNISDGNYASGTNANATFDITFANNDKGTGSFSATPCGSMETFSDQLVAAENGSSTQTGPIYLIDGVCE